MTAPASIASAEHYLWGNGCDGWHLLKRQDLSIIQERVPAGQSEVIHLHRTARQFFYILEGEGTILLGAAKFFYARGMGWKCRPVYRTSS